MKDTFEINLVQAPESDLDEIYALCHNVAVRTPSSGWGEEYPTREILAHDLATQTLYKVPHDSKIASIMQIRSWAEFQKGEVVDDIKGWNPSTKNPCGLGRFCVSPDFQGQGLGRRVMLKMLETAKEMGYDSARFHAVTTNPIANHLYESMGFRLAGRIEEYGKEFFCYEMILA